MPGGVTRMAGEDGALVMWDNSVVKRYDMVRLRELEKRYGKGSKAQRDRVLQMCIELQTKWARARRLLHDCCGV